MIFLRVLLMAVWVLAPVATLSAAAAKSRPTRPGPSVANGSFKGAIVVDARTGDVLFEEQADVVSPPASMAKLMTYAVLHDLIRRGTITLDTPITANAADTKMGGTQVWLKEGETFPVEELIYAMLVQSANDAAHALARSAAGSREAFLDLMNAKAAELGMTSSTFRTPHGLPPANRRVAEGDLTSPRDFARLARYLVDHTDVLKYTSVRQRSFGRPVRLQTVDMVNHNHLLGKFAGLDGLKTGFTNGAGFCLAATAERNGTRLIAVVMGSPDSKTRDLGVAALLEKAFATASSSISSANQTPAGPKPPPTISVPSPTSPVPDEGPTIKLTIPTKK